MIFCVEHVRIALDIQIEQLAEQFQYKSFIEKGIFLNVFEMIKETHTYRFLTTKQVHFQSTFFYAVLFKAKFHLF